MTSFHDHANIHEELGLEIGELGAVMLDLQPFTDKRLLPSSFLYESPSPDRWWIKGWVSDKPHLTLKYGLLRPAEEWADYVNQVLQGWTPESVKILDVSSFESPYPDEDYACIILAIQNSENLQDAYARLSYLPHVDTFTPFRPHVTLAYVKKECEVDAVNMLRGWFFALREIEPMGLNLGSDRS